MPPVLTETCNILDMYRLLTRSFQQLSGPEKRRVEKEAGVFKDYVRYQGFDGNNDEHLGIVKYLVKNLRRYSEVKNADLNSHSSGTLTKYRRMLEVLHSMID